jgi:UDP-N-acetylmuramyl pentapeptide phosphotransferase/UDP-N-acetylglucosamine-1-phosphate transferase
MSLWGVKDGLFPGWIFVLIFSPFIVDATATLIRRGYRGEKIWQAHKTHYYQRIAKTGLGQRRIVVPIYVLMIACAVSAAFAIHAPLAAQWGIVVGWSVIYFLLISVIPEE